MTASRFVSHDNMEDMKLRNQQSSNNFGFNQECTPQIISSVDIWRCELQWNYESTVILQVQ